MTTNQKQGSRQTKETRQRSRPPGPVGQGPAALMEAADRLLLQRAVADPVLAAPADILALQQAYGNQAVQRLVLQRQGPEEEEEIQAKAIQQVGLEGGPVSPEVESAITRARGAGQPLDGALQKQMSETMGHDFSGVRVHTGQDADELNQQLSAKAFTTGADIFFRRGAYDPASSGGRELVAHELSHVVQQSTGRVTGTGGSMAVRSAGDAFEQEADALARQAASGGQEVLSPIERERIQRAPSAVGHDTIGVKHKVLRTKEEAGVWVPEKPRGATHHTAIQRELYQDLAPAGLDGRRWDSPQVEIEAENKDDAFAAEVKIKTGTAEMPILCTPAVAAALGWNPLARVADVQKLKKKKVWPKKNRTPNEAAKFIEANKIVNFFSGDQHVHAGVSTGGGHIAGYNQGVCVQGGGGEGKFTADYVKTDPEDRFDSIYVGN